MRRRDSRGPGVTARTPATTAFEALNTTAEARPTSVNEEIPMAAHSPGLEILREALPILGEMGRERHRRLLEALIAGRVSDGASRDERLGAAFALHAEGLISRGEVRDIYDLSLFDFMELEERFASDHQPPLEF